MSTEENNIVEVKEKRVELTVKALVQTASGSKAVANEIAKGAKDFSDKAKINGYNKRIKK